MEVRITCPLGSDCEVAKDGYIERCAWYVELAGKDPQSGKVIDEWKCAIAWEPILLVEAVSSSRAVGASLQSLRNETVKRQDIALEVMSAKVLRN